MAGFEFRETMTGTYHRLDAPGDERAMSITVRAEASGLRKFLFDPTTRIEGEVDAQGLADHRALRGTLEINPILKRRLVYDFAFEDNDGRPCRFHGEKELDALRLVSTMTTLPGSIWRDDVEIARAVLRFHVRADLVSFVRSVRHRTR
jgi:hypothetical protein